MFFRLTPVVKNLIIINVIVFIGRNVLQVIPFELAYYSFTLDEFRPYQIITNFFAHGYVGHPGQFNHLLFNMLGLFFFGTMLEDRIGSKPFGIIYLISAFFGLIFSETFHYFSGSATVLVGASGAVMGIVAALATHSPHQKIQLLFPPIPVKLMYLAIFYFGYDIIGSLRGSSGGGIQIGHLVHIGGAIAGFIMMKFWYFRK